MTFNLFSHFARDVPSDVWVAGSPKDAKMLTVGKARRPNNADVSDKTDSLTIRASVIRSGGRKFAYEANTIRVAKSHETSLNFRTLRSRSA